MENNQSNSSNKRRARNQKMSSYMTTFGLMLFGMLVIFSYVYQSTKQVYLNYEIVNLNKEINSLNIRLTESKVENERLQTNEYVEKVAGEKLGMSYEKSDRVVVVKETEKSEEKPISDDNIKIKIFMKSLYEQANKMLKQFNIENIKNYFNVN
ncbi:hypothetical protein ACSW8S_19725 (plasmid) [Clostridium perfringens]